MFSTHNEAKSFLVKRSVRNLKNKIHKCMSPISKNVCIEKLDDIVNKVKK